MIIQKLHLKNFRCFQDREFTFTSKFVVIQGDNGSGKSSLLEALHYSCYLRSFRTHLQRDLVAIGQDHFFTHVEFDQEITGTHDHIQSGYSEREGKLVKFNQKPVQSYRDIISSFRIVTLAADDLALVHGAPECRRDFLNYSLFLLDPAIIATFKRHKQIVDHRNSLLSLFGQQGRQSYEDEMLVWSEKLWAEALIIREARRAYLAQIEGRVNDMLQGSFASDVQDMRVSFTYEAKGVKGFESFADFWQQFKQGGHQRELQTGRTLFGAHLDDFLIVFQNKKARVFASRGQQKLLVFLLKLAQLQLTNVGGEPGVLLLDDFMTDFDSSRLERCISVINSINFQIFITCPLKSGSLPAILHNFENISL
jgi:DNA replication and repair protein RecF